MACCINEYEKKKKEKEKNMIISAIYHKALLVKMGNFL